MSSRNHGRSRLSTEARRAQLLEIGAGLFAEMPYDEVRITEVADRAGVSRGLLYHYFPTKQDFAIAVTQIACSQVFDDADPDPSVPITDQLRRVLSDYVAFAAEHADSYRAMHTGLIADPKVRQLRRADLARHEARVLVALGAGDAAPALLVTAVRAWLAFVIAAVLDWLAERATSSEAVVELCTQALIDIASSAVAQSSSQFQADRQP